MLSKVRVLGLTLPLLFATILAGCVTQSSESEETFAHMARVRLYSSTAEFAADSAVVVIGTAKSEAVAADIDGVTEFTLVQFVPDEVLQGADQIDGREAIVVRQTGSAKQGSPAPLMVLGERYLLYLTPSGLEGKLADHFYVTGANAGLYVEGEPGTFLQFDRQDGEELPTSLSRQGALG